MCITVPVVVGRWSRQLEVPKEDKFSHYQPYQFSDDNNSDWLPSAASSSTIAIDNEESWDLKIHVEQFCEKTSLHGLQYLGEKNRHWCERYHLRSNL